MEDNSQKRTSRTSSSTSSPMSKEDKLKRSMKGLSHMNGGMGGGASLDSLNSATKMSKDKSERKKVGGVVLDLDTIQGANQQKFETKGRRNNVIILILSLLLVISLVFLAISIVRYKNSKKKANLKYTVEGSAEWVIEGGSKTEVLLRQGLARDMIYLIDTDLNITTSDSVSLIIEIEVLLDGSPILISGLHEANEKLVRIDNTNNYEYQGEIVGGGVIQIFDGIDFTDAPANLSSNNIKININAVVVKN